MDRRHDPDGRAQTRFTWIKYWPQRWGDQSGLCTAATNHCAATSGGHKSGHTAYRAAVTHHDVGNSTSLLRARPLLHLPGQMIREIYAAALLSGSVGEVHAGVRLELRAISFEEAHRDLAENSDGPRGAHGAASSMPGRAK